MLTKALDFLLGTQIDTGGWGYTLDGDAFVEPTAAVISALVNTPQASDTLRKATNWLLSFQNPDGGWGICPIDKESGWQTAWALLALHQLDPEHQAIERGVDWLLHVDVMQYTDSELLAAGESVAKIDFSLRGWPWLPGQASWVEPTSLAMRILHHYRSFEGVAGRIHEAVSYLKDRRCTAGGWNIGNPVMFEANFPARVNPTAWALLTLAEVSPQDIRDEDIVTLRYEMFQDQGVMGFAWGLTALHRLGEDDAEARSMLLSLQDVDGSWKLSPYLTAISYQALAEEF